MVSDEGGQCPEHLPCVQSMLLGSQSQVQEVTGHCPETGQVAMVSDRRDQYIDPGQGFT